MAIYGYQSKDDIDKNRLAQQAQALGAMQAFANFMQKNKENQAQAQYQRDTVGVQRDQNFINMLGKGFVPMGQSPMQGQITPNAPQMGGPSLAMPSPGGGGFLSQQQLAQQNQANAAQSQQPNGSVPFMGQQWQKNPDFIEPNSFEDYARKQSLQESLKEKRIKEQRISAIVNRKLSKEESEFMGTAPVLLEKIDRLLPQLGTDTELKSYAPFGLGDKDAQIFKDDLAYIKNVILKARSGGAVTESEADRLLQNFPSLTGRKETDASKLNAFKKEIMGIAKRVRFGTLSGDDEALVNEYLSGGQDPSSAQSSAPTVGGMFNGQKVLKVTQVK